MTTESIPALPQSSSLVTRIDAALARSMERFFLVSGRSAAETQDLVSALTRVTAAGGKRIRPQLFYWGYRAGGEPDRPEVIELATAIELFHVFALVHDDLMDRADTRRGVPTAHRQLASLHRERGWNGDSEHFGFSAGILAGDALCIWADMIISNNPLPGGRTRPFRRAYDEMRLELISGQYLDISSGGSGDCSMAGALRLARLKSGNYSVSMPLRLGALAGGVDEGTIRGFGSFGTALGEAFQIHDDILGVFGSPAEVGKPVGEDIRQGKRTTLIAAALAGARPDVAARLLELLADPGLSEAGVDEAKEIIRSSGALDRVRGMLRERVRSAKDTLAGLRLDAEVHQALLDLVRVVAHSD
ncbi:polyprenyl synthetase family protein [Allokutzneria albata]|uniref:Geranylgeranyl diphosphate synthase, type I n=1 Tax=Allokutzneria albata TaxID=211114 RepID=A0A1H0BPG5_ALLAB|nr:polyprenyl synthetase family protein [Allokutzneria albata]SDN47472.1 geranylgeranyl diphosphate synthase, type I [Allokutzneria albata]